MRALTFNLWHGLSPTNPVLFEALEPTSRRDLREALQAEMIAEVAPDLCFFQEVNPIAKRARTLSRALQLNAVHQPDLAGLKLFGLGLPLNLNSGLLILANEIKKLCAVSLDRPGVHLVHEWGSWQLREERFALFAECHFPKWGPVLVINTHLHHGLELTPDMLEKLNALARELELPDAMMDEFKSRLSAGNRRRAAELAVLLKTIEEFESQYEFVILAGDFNASPDNEFWAPLKDAGFHDTWLAAGNAEPGFTFDREANAANHLLQASFPLTLVVEDLSFSPKVREALLELARAQETRPRRIDFIWYRGRSAAVRVDSARLIGHPNAEGLAPSDHFGVLAELDVR